MFQPPQRCYTNLWQQNSWHRSAHPGVMPGCSEGGLGSSLSDGPSLLLDPAPSPPSALLQHSPIPHASCPVPVQIYLLGVAWRLDLASTDQHPSLCQPSQPEEAQTQPCNIFVALPGWCKGFTAAHHNFRIALPVSFCCGICSSNGENKKISPFHSGVA